MRDGDAEQRRATKPGAERQAAERGEGERDDQALRRAGERS